jgi:hypothetical protein
LLGLLFMPRSLALKRVLGLSLIQSALDKLLIGTQETRTARCERRSWPGSGDCWRRHLGAAICTPGQTRRCYRNRKCERWGAPQSPLFPSPLALTRCIVRFIRIWHRRASLSLGTSCPHRQFPLYFHRVLRTPNCTNNVQ